MRKKLLLALALPWLVLLVHACGGSDESPGFVAQKSACETASEELCTRACECAAGVGCSFNGPSPAKTSQFPSVEECTNFLLQLECKGSTHAEVDYEACQDAVKSAKCVVDEQGKKAVSRPLECTVPVDKPDAGKDAPTKG